MRIVPTLEREALALSPDATCHSRLYTEAATASLFPQRVAATLLSAVGLYHVRALVMWEALRLALAGLAADPLTFAAAACVLAAVAAAASYGPRRGRRESTPCALRRE